MLIEVWPSGHDDQANSRRDGEAVMNGSGIPDPPGFGELTKEEQVRYLEALWDRIADQPGELPAPQSHLELAEQRLAAHRTDPNRANPAFAVIDRLSKRSG
jgi:putative addiction module component (TIGR02574 family)